MGDRRSHSQIREEVAVERVLVIHRVVVRVPTLRPTADKWESDPMSAMWTKDVAGWHVMSPVGFPNEATLHDLIEEAPNLLPLSGAPRLTVLGREVGLPSGAADLVAVEATGQPVFIEIKLERNPEARRAVVAQVLSYAASVHGLDVSAFETQVLGSHLRKRGYSSIFDAVASTDDSGAFDSEAFTDILADSLASGAARLVLVLDAAPPELMRLAGYLEAVSERLVIDLITVSQYDVGGQGVIVPQRVDPGREQEDRIAQLTRAPRTRTQYFEGGDEFFAAVAEATVGADPTSEMVCEWARRLSVTVSRGWPPRRARSRQRCGSGCRTKTEGWSHSGRPARALPSPTGVQFFVAGRPRQYRRSRRSPGRS